MLRIMANYFSVFPKLPSLRKKYNFSSSNYWDSRYRNNGSSGRGSYGHLAAFKADFLNGFVIDKNVESVLELGCGDGNQLSLALYPSSGGLDVSKKAIEMCKKIFLKDSSKSFSLLSEDKHSKAELILSLDVIYHLVEDDIFVEYMSSLFDRSLEWVVVYSSNFTCPDQGVSEHVKHREFVEWVKLNRKDFSLYQVIPNKYPLDRFRETGSFADFYIFRKIN